MQAEIENTKQMEDNVKAKEEVKEFLENNRKKRKKSWWSSGLVQWCFSLIMAIALALFIRAYLFELVIVKGNSMDYTLETHQRLFVNKLAYTFSSPNHGDVVIIMVDREEPLAMQRGEEWMDQAIRNSLSGMEEADYVKRIVGLPWDHIQMIDGALYRNGERLYEPYAKGRTIPREFGEDLIVPEGYFFVLGDNREISRDSRDHGSFPESAIKGRATHIVYPFRQFGRIAR